MNDKHFDAIIAKNNIARELAQFKRTGYISIEALLFDLKTIEAYTGEANQPSVMDSYHSEGVLA